MEQPGAAACRYSCMLLVLTIVSSLACDVHSPMTLHAAACRRVREEAERREREEKQRRLDELRLRRKVAPAASPRP